MKEQDYIHKIVLKVIGDLKLNFSEHYDIEFIACANKNMDEFKYITAFFRTEDEKGDAFADGLCNLIDRQFVNLSMEYDKKNIITNEKKYIVYDSIENLNKNYEGKMQLYFK